MISIGIVGFGNVAENVHLPLLVVNSEVRVDWVVDPNLDRIYLLKKLKISLLKSIDLFEDVSVPDIVLVTSPYGTRAAIFDFIRGKVKGVYCEKPFAKSVKEHLSVTNDYEDYAFTIGYQRRSLGNVNVVKNLVEANAFGELKEVYFEFGDYGMRSGRFQGNLQLAGGGILFESGVHWIDTVLYTLGAIDAYVLDSKVEYESGFDIHTEADLIINTSWGQQIPASFVITQLKRTMNKIIYKFEHADIELELFSDSARPLVTPHGNRYHKYEVTNYLKDVIPSSSLGQGYKYWSDFLAGFSSKKKSYVSASESLLTTKVIEQLYCPACIP